MTEAVNLQKTKALGLALLSPLKRDVERLGPLTADTYPLADEALGRVVKARAKWMELCRDILQPSADAVIKAKASLAAAKKSHTANEAHHQLIDGPMASLEIALKASMREFKLNEARLLREAEEAAAREQARLDTEIEAKRQAEASARTSQMRAKMAVAREVLETKQAEAVERPTAAPIKGQSSAARFQKKVRVKAGAELTVLLAVVNGEIPGDIITIEPRMLEAHYKADPEAVRSWPGVEEYDDVIIARR